MRVFLFFAMLCFVAVQINSCSGSDSDSSESVSSSSVAQETVQMFCVFFEQQLCVPTAMPFCPQGAQLNVACPFTGQGSSSSTNIGVEPPSSGSSSNSEGEGGEGELSSSSDTETVDNSSSSSDISSSSVPDVSSSSVPTSSSSSLALPSSSSVFVGGLSSSGALSGNVFIDPRDGKIYEYSIVSSKLWMKQNLNYSRNNTLGYCYGVDIDGVNPNRDSTSCGNGYGRTYKWSVAMDGMSGAGSQGLCPDGWHIPAYTEWGSGVPAIYAGNYNNNEDYPPLGWKARGSEGLYWTSSDNTHFAFTQSTGTAYQMNNTAGAADYFSVRCVANATWNCGSEPYNPVTSFCFGNSIYPRCSNNAYDVATSGCCGTSTYVLATHFCVGTKSYAKCGGQTYEPPAESCSGTTITLKCGTSSTYYDPALKFCSGNTTYDLCGGEEYNPTTHGCKSGTTIQPKCGSTLYNPTIEFCVGTTVYDKCDGQTYNPVIETCDNGDIVEKPYVLYEDFEGEDTWEKEAYSGTNRWIIGSATSKNGLKSAYITNDGVANYYSINATSSANMYKSVTFPTQTTNFTLSFDLKVGGELYNNIIYDYMQVYLLPPITSISGSVQPPEGSRIGSTAYYNNNSNSSWTHITIDLPYSTYSGKTYNLLFYWTNDSSGGNQPPAAIDNILIE